MDCETLRASAFDYAEGRLSAEDRARYDAHARSCDACREFARVCAEITCREVSDVLDDYLDGELESDRRAVLERHLSICQACVDYLHSYELTRDLTRSSRAVSEAGPLPERLIRAILEQRREDRDSGGAPPRRDG